MNNSQITRSQLIDLTNAAYQLGNFESARKLFIAWLKVYPNDLWIRYRLAIVLYKSGKKNEAIRLCEVIIRYDPEFIEVWELLAALYPQKSEDRKDAVSRVKLLKSFEKQDAAKNQKGLSTIFARKPGQKPFDDIEDVDDFDVLSAIRVARSELQQKDANSYFRMMKIYSRRWPKALQFKLLLGDAMNQSGNPDQGTKLIHSTLADDLLGQVANRIWKNDNRYQKLWVDPESLSIDVSRIEIPGNILKKAKLESLTTAADDGFKTSNSGEAQLDVKDVFVLPGTLQPLEENPIPEPIEPLSLAEKAGDLPTEARMALNSGCLPSALGFVKQLFSGKTKTQPDSLDSIKEFVYKLDVNDADERFPVYVVLSTIAGLTAKYGKNNKDFIDQEMHSVADAVDNREGWNAVVFYPDEFQSNGKTVLDPQSIRNALIKLDETLSQKGSMIGAVLIVGGHDVVPFFTLANPAMDDDLSIHSDIPYGSHDLVRYYDQQWQVGRVPGDNTNDPGLLLSQLRSIQNHHISRFEMEQSKTRKKTTKPQRLGKTIKGIKSFGYCCSVWQRPSVAVYRNISDSANLLTSPPTMASNFPATRLEGMDFGYFNLHGIKGQPNWYGQKDSRDTSAIPMIPIALEMQNIQRVSKTPKVVFAENCYGAEIVNRSELNAFSLHMIGKGTRVFIGSTVIAYGAMNLPLTAADLLGHLFWKHLMTGISCGEAFRRAKKNLATETESRSGALDGEIQKTLISFVYYGDPLYAISDSSDITDRMQRAKTAKSYELIREKMDSKVVIDTDMAKRIYSEVKEMYDMQGASDEFSTFTIQKQILNAKSNGSPSQIAESQNYVIVYSKDAKMGSMLDRLITRVTVTRDGKIKKVSFSR